VLAAGPSARLAMKFCPKMTHFTSASAHDETFLLFYYKVASRHCESGEMDRLAPRAGMNLFIILLLDNNHAEM
jgi:hypothetical protein